MENHMSSRPALKSHQISGVAWTRDVRRGLLADEPGLGKSRIAIETFDGANVLVVAPTLVIDGGTWDEEILKWSNHPEKWRIAPYSMLNERGKGPKGGSKPIKKLREDVRQPWDALVLDEAHYVKGRGTLWTWAAKQLADRADYFLAMTGTPIPNWAHELFTILQMIYHEEAKPGGKYGAFWRWAGLWFDTSPSRFSNGNPVVGEMLGCLRQSYKAKECLARPSTDPCEHYTEFATANLGERFLRRYREDCLDLPPHTDQTIETPMTVAQKRVYQELKRDFATTVSGETILAWTQGKKNVLLDKITTSPWLLNREGPPRGGKLDLLKFDLESRSRPTVVFAHYRDSVEACAAVGESIGARTRFIHGGTSRADNREALTGFRNGEVDVLVGSLETMAEGLTLTQADMVILVEQSMKPSRNKQAVDRIHRMGQERPVTIKRYVTPNCVDSRKLKRLATKTDRQMRLMTAAEYMELL